MSSAQQDLDDPDVDALAVTAAPTDANATAETQTALTLRERLAIEVPADPEHAKVAAELPGSLR